MPRRAFTLLEVSLVAVLLLMLAMMAYPSIEAMYGGVRLTAAADLIRARWADARAHAIDESKPYRFAIVPDTGRFRVAHDRAHRAEIGGTGRSRRQVSPPRRLAGILRFFRSRYHRCKPRLTATAWLQRARRFVVA